MPGLLQVEMDEIVEQILKNSKRTNISTQEEVIAKKEREEYFNSKRVDVSELSTLSIYFINSLEAQYVSFCKCCTGFLFLLLLF